MAKNALAHSGKTGIFNGKPRFYKVGDIMGDEAPALFIVNNIMVGVLKNNFLQALLAKRDARKLGHGDEIHPPKYLDGKITIERAIELIKRNTRHYAKRQMTWFNKDKRIQWFDIKDISELDQIAKKISGQLIIIE